MMIAAIRNISNFYWEIHITYRVNTYTTHLYFILTRDPVHRKESGKS